MKKTFSCGHRGKGTVCHRCIQEASVMKEIREAKKLLGQIKEGLRKQERQRKHNLITTATANRVEIPRGCEETVIIAATELIKRIKQGENLIALGGKKLYLKMGWSFRLGRSWRGIYKNEILRVLTHEEYNTITGGKSKRGVG